MDRVGVKTFSKLEGRKKDKILDHGHVRSKVIDISTVALSSFNFLMRCVWKSRLRISSRVGDWTAKCFRTTGWMACSRHRPTQQERHG
jgi:hypothetical protein